MLRLQDTKAPTAMMVAPGDCPLLLTEKRDPILAQS